MNIEKEIVKIQNRNKRVEIDKAWETSKTRKVIIALLTYFVMVLVMSILGLGNPFVGAIIPTFGFILSTFSVQFVKSIWMKIFYK